MFENLIELAAKHGLVPVTLFLLALSNALLLLIILRLKDDNYKNISDEIRGVKDELHAQFDLNKENISKLESILNRLHADVNKLFEEVSKQESEGKITHVTRQVEKIKDDLIELKTIITMWFSKEDRVR